MPKPLWPQLRWPWRSHKPRAYQAQRSKPHRSLRKTQRGQRRYAVGPAPAQQPRRQLVPDLPWLRLGVAAIAVVALSGSIYGGYWLLEGDTLRVRHANVVGAEVADPLEIAALADLGGRSMLNFDSEEAASRIVEALPEVKAATVTRDWPQTVVISVTEHQGWGYWQAGGRRVVIDIDGLVIPKGRPPAADAVTIFAIGASRPLEPGDHADPNTVATVAQILDDARSQRLGLVPERFEFYQDRGLVVRVEDGPDVVFGDWHNYAFKVAAWGALLNRIERERLEVSEIDLRFGQQLVMR